LFQPYIMIYRRKKISIFRGVTPPKPPSLTFLAPAILVSTIYNDLSKKKKISIFRGGDPPKPPP
jgi:hypothetical protein